jgi:hypothetical protein
MTGFRAPINAVLFVLFSSLIAACAKGPGPAPPNPSSVSSRQLPAELDLRTAACQVKDIAGNPVTFGHTRIGQDVDVKDDHNLCAIAKAAAAYDAERTRTYLTKSCDEFKPMLRQTYGTDDFAAVLELARSSWDRNDPSALKTASILLNCSDIEATAGRSAADTPIRIYSVGRLRNDGASCIGYLLEQKNGPLNSRRYDLLTTGTCGSTTDFASAKLVVEGNLTPLPGNEIRDRVAYTGDLPNDIMYKGELKPFVSELVATAPISPSPVKSSSPRSTPDEPDTAATTVRAFYAALGRGDGEAASNLMIPEKRGAGPFAPESISRFYGSLIEPLHLVDFNPQGSGVYLVGYQFRASSRQCRGRAVVTTARREGLFLIEKIRPLNGC